MAYTIDKNVLEHLAIEVADLYNICQNSQQFQPEHIEIHLILIDYDDGIGYRIVSRVAIRHPVENIYTMVVDVQGSPEDALNSMLKTLKEQAESDFYSKYKEKIAKYN